MQSIKHLIQRFNFSLACTFLVLSSFLALTPCALASDLPSLGNASSRVISIEQEKKLGQAWLRSLRGQAKTFQHPIVESYFSELVYSLAPYSEVQDKNFSFVILDSKALNAFAVPGSIIGINAGLFIHAPSEQEFASVLAHELAHISQRHYARRLEQQQLSTPLTFAGLLASVLVAATAGSEAGLAAMASTQALAVEKQLSFSRQNEEEADRLGITTLYEAGYDPRAMPIMFERMYRQTRIQGGRLPEYLSTHPLSENRVADTRNRASLYPKKTYSNSLEYALCQAIIINYYAESEAAAENYFRAILATNEPSSHDSATFGLALSLGTREPSEAVALLTRLQSKYPYQISITSSLGEALFNKGETEKALSLLREQLQRNPENYTLSIYLVDGLTKLGRYNEANSILKPLSRKHHDKPLVWYLLAENQGKLDNIDAVHQARAEYFVLKNQLEKALEQLRFAKSKTENTVTQNIIEQRISEVQQLKKDSPF